MADEREDEPLVVTAVRTGIRDGIVKAVAGVVAAVLIAAVTQTWQRSGADSLPRWRSDVVQSFSATERKAMLTETVVVEGSPVSVYRDAGEVRKLVTVDANDEATEFYYTAGRLVFAYQHPVAVPGGLAASSQTGDRFYFHSNPLPLIGRTRIFLWIGPHQTRVREGAEFEQRGRRLVQRADALLSAVQARS